MTIFTLRRGADNRSSSIKESYAASITSRQDGEDGSESTMAPPPPALTLKVKAFDYYQARGMEWKYKDMGSKVVAEMCSKLIRGIQPARGNDSWQKYMFVFVRTIPSSDRRPPGDEGDGTPTFKFVLRSPYLIEGCNNVIKDYPGISWKSDSVEISPEVLLAHLPQFESYHGQLSSKKNTSQDDESVAASVGVLITYLYKHYNSTIAKIKSLKENGEIMSGLLYAIMIPRTILVMKCPITGELRAVQLVVMNTLSSSNTTLYELVVENIDAADDAEQLAFFRFGKVSNKLMIPQFQGTMKINALDAYPIHYHPAEKELRQMFITRGRKWMSLNGIHHRYYNGFAAVKVGKNNKLLRYNINSRVMIDRGTFRRLNPNYMLPTAKPPMSPGREQYLSNNDTQGPTLFGQKMHAGQALLSDDDLLLTPPVVYGFSLKEKLWLGLNVDKVQDIRWSQEAFSNLVLPDDRKEQLQSLVEAHTHEGGFDDFVEGKGQGLVINLFGNPGVGKTLTAEATSEYLQRPLYIVGAGDLGTTAAELNQALEQTFDTATTWKAIVLLDEADVFMEERAANDLERNSFVAVFLRHLEYYRGILFLTTNRIKTIDEAFLSRIHVALHFKELSTDAKRQVWSAFLAKVGVKVGGTDGRITEAQLKNLAERDINGRQIKNAVRTASSLALGRNEKLDYTHLSETLEVMDDFKTEFNAIKAASKLDLK